LWTAFASTFAAPPAAGPCTTHTTRRPRTSFTSAALVSRCLRRRADARPARAACRLAMDAVSIPARPPSAPNDPVSGPSRCAARWSSCVRSLISPTALCRLGSCRGRSRHYMKDAGYMTSESEEAKFALSAAWTASKQACRKPSSLTTSSSGPLSLSLFSSSPPCPSRPRYARPGAVPAHSARLPDWAGRSFFYVPHGRTMQPPRQQRRGQLIYI
jgi:hypothetical protein